MLRYVELECGCVCFQEGDLRLKIVSCSTSPGDDSDDDLTIGNQAYSVSAEPRKDSKGIKRDLPLSELAELFARVGKLVRDGQRFRAIKRALS